MQDSPLPPQEPESEPEPDTPILIALAGGGKSAADECALVLVAEGIDVRIRRVPAGYALELPYRNMQRALASLESYADEARLTKRNEARRAAELTELRDPSWVGVPIGLGLLLIHAWTGERDAGHFLFAAGSARAGLITTGEWWRCFTALFLHADWGHVFANVCAGLYFMGAVCRSYGHGHGLALILAAGALGNLCNAFVHASYHNSVGASTAVFGAIGILAGQAVAYRHGAGVRGRHLLIPLGAGLGLLAMLGTGGERVDLWAHFFGLQAGALLAMISAMYLPGRISRRQQNRVGLCCALIVAFCWSLALR